MTKIEQVLCLRMWKRLPRKGTVIQAWHQKDNQHAN